jgi:hypothetical protein
MLNVVRESDPLHQGFFGGEVFTHMLVELDASQPAFRLVCRIEQVRGKPEEFLMLPIDGFIAKAVTVFPLVAHGG